MERYEYDSVIREDPESGGAYVTFPWDIRQEFGKGRVKVKATLDREDRDREPAKPYS